MRAYSTPMLDYLAARRGVHAEILVWFQPQDWTTGVRVGLGLWTGAEDDVVTIGGSDRTYAAGGQVELDDLTYEIGLVVRVQTLRLTGLSAAVRTILSDYNVRLAPVEVHRALYDLTSGALLEEPTRIFKGFVDQAPESIPEEGGAGSVDVALVSSARALTRGLALKKSDESQRRRLDDRFARWADVSGNVKVWWGARPSRK